MLTFESFLKCIFVLILITMVIKNNDRSLIFIRIILVILLSAQVSQTRLYLLGLHRRRPIRSRSSNNSSPADERRSTSQRRRRLHPPAASLFSPAPPCRLPSSRCRLRRTPPSWRIPLAWFQWLSSNQPATTRSSDVYINRST